MRAHPTRSWARSLDRSWLADPAEGFLDPLADALAQSVAGMARRAAVDRRRAAVRILRYVRRRVHRAQFTDEVLGVVSLVGAERNRPRSGWRQDRPRCPGGLPRRRIRNRLERLQLMRGRQRGRGRRTPQSTAWRGRPHQPLEDWQRLLNSWSSSIRCGVERAHGPR